MFSQRSAFARLPNRLERARQSAQAAGRRVLDLTESNPTNANLPRTDAALRALLHPDAGSYRPEPFGLRSAREALSAFLREQGTAVPADRIVLTASTSEVYAFLFKLLCDPGDDVLVPAPSYPLFEHLAQLEAVHARSYRLQYDGRWHLPAGTLAPLRGPRTRALLTVHPNNPTGSYLKRDELAQLAAVGLPIVSDEVFAGYPLGDDPERVGTAWGATPVLTFALHGLSKLAGLPQLKLAWTCVSGPDAQVQEALGRLELIADSFLSVSTPVQLALPAILDAHAERTDAIRARLRVNLAQLEQRLAGSAASVLHVEGGWYAIVWLPALLDDEGWALQLLERHDVLVQPGYFYELAAGPFVVISLLTPEPILAAGAARLHDAVCALTDGG